MGGGGVVGGGGVPSPAGILGFTPVVPPGRYLPPRSFCHPPGGSVGPGMSLGRFRGLPVPLTVLVPWRCSHCPVTGFWYQPGPGIPPTLKPLLRKVRFWFAPFIRAHAIRMSSWIGE